MLLVLGALAVASSHAVHAQASCPVRYTVDPVVVRQEAAVFGEAEVARFCRQLPARRGPVRYEAFISALVDLVRPSLQAGHADRVSAFLQALSDKKAVVGERSPGRGNAGASFVARFALDEAARGEYVLVSAPAGTPAAPLVATDTVRRPFAISSEGDPSEMVVVVRGTRGREPRKNTPERVTVIDAKEIERKAPRTTEEIFLGVPGVDVVRQGGGFTSSVSNVVLRGLGGQARGRTLVVVDGMVMNDPYSSDVLWDAIPVHEIERVEILHGGASSLYGSGAMGGVINIMTRRPGKPQTRILANYGSLDTTTLSFSHSDSSGRLGWSVTGDLFDTAGYVSALQPRSYDVRRTKDSVTLATRLAYDLGHDGSLGLNLRHHNDTIGAGRPLYHGSRDSDAASLTYKQKIGRVDASALLYYNHDYAAWTYDKSPTYKLIDYETASPRRSGGGNLQGVFRLSDLNSLTTGLDYRWGDVTSQDLYQASRQRILTGGRQTLAGFYLQDQWRVHPALNLCVGARLDSWRSYDGSQEDPSVRATPLQYPARSSSAISPNLGLVFSATDALAVRASYAHSFRAPTLYDLYTTWRYVNTTYLCNPDLAPERVASYDVGVDYRPRGSAFSASLDAYYNDAANLIYSVDVARNTKQRRNISRATTQGLELGLSWRLSPQWSLTGGCTLNSSVVRKYLNPTLEGRQLTYTPKTKVSLGVAYKSGGFQADLRGRQVGAVYTDDLNTSRLGAYVILDARLSQELEKDLVASLRLDNLGGARYQEYLGQLGPPFTVSIGLDKRF